MANLPYAIIDAVMVSIAGVSCTLAIIFWLAIVTLRWISMKNRRDSTVAQHKDIEVGMTNTTQSVRAEESTCTCTSVTQVAQSNSINIATRQVTLNGSIEEPDGPFRDTIVEGASEVDRRFSIKKNMHKFVRYVLPAMQIVLRECIVPSLYVKQLLLFSFVVLALSVYIFISSYLFIKLHYIDLCEVYLLLGEYVLEYYTHVFSFHNLFLNHRQKIVSFYGCTYVCKLGMPFRMFIHVNKCNIVKHNVHEFWCIQSHASICIHACL